MNSRFRRDHVAHSIVLEANHCIGDLVEPGERFLRLGLAPFALKCEWQSREGYHKRAGFTGQVRDRARRPNRCRHPGPHKQKSFVHPSALREFLRPILQPLVTELRVATRAQTACHSAAQLHLVRARPNWRATARRC